MICPKCKNETLEQFKGMYICTNCQEVIKEPGCISWCQSLAQENKLWNQKALTTFPYIISNEYKGLKRLLEENQKFGCVLQIKDVFEVIIKFPVAILLKAIDERVQELAKQDKLSMKTIKSKYPNLYGMLEIVLTSQLTLGHWEILSAKAAKLQPVELPKANKELYLETVHMIKKTSYKHKKQNISTWRNEVIGHGAMELNDNEEFRTKIRDLLITIKGIMDGWEEYYGRFTKAGAGEFSNIIEYTAAGGEKCMEDLDPYLELITNKLFIFDSYYPWKERAFILNYSDGLKEYSDVLANRLGLLKNQLELASIGSDDFFSANISKSEIKKLEGRLNKTELLPPKHFEGKVNSMLSNYSKGVFLLEADSGMGKTVFSRAIDELDSYHYENSKNKFPNTLIRSWHFNSLSSSRRDIFSHGIIDMLLIDSVSRENDFAGDCYNIKLEYFKALENAKPGTERKKVFADCLNNIMKTYRDSYRYDYDRMILILDGIDEYSISMDVEEAYREKYNQFYDRLSIFDMIPDSNQLPDNVYILLTSRTKREITGNQYALQELIKLDFDEIFTCDKHDPEYRELLHKYIGKFILKLSLNKLSEDDEAKIRDIMNFCEDTFVYVNAFRKLYGNGEAPAGKKDSGYLAAYLDNIRMQSVYYYKRIIRLLSILYIIEEPVSLYELAYLTGDENIDFLLISILNDLQCFLETRRGDNSNLYSISHGKWKQELAAIIGEDLLAEERSRLLKMYNDFIQELNVKGKNINIANYEGELLLAANIDRIMHGKTMDIQTHDKESIYKKESAPEIIEGLTKIVNLILSTSLPKKIWQRKMQVFDILIENYVVLTKEQETCENLLNYQQCLLHRFSYNLLEGRLEGVIRDEKEALRCLERIHELDDSFNTGFIIKEYMAATAQLMETYLKSRRFEELTDYYPKAISNIINTFGQPVFNTYSIVQLMRVINCTAESYRYLGDMEEFSGLIQMICSFRQLLLKASKNTAGEYAAIVTPISVFNIEGKFNIDINCVRGIVNGYILLLKYLLYAGRHDEFYGFLDELEDTIKELKKQTKLRLDPEFEVLEYIIKMYRCYASMKINMSSEILTEYRKIERIREDLSKLYKGSFSIAEALKKVEWIEFECRTRAYAASQNKDGIFNILDECLDKLKTLPVIEEEGLIDNTASMLHALKGEFAFKASMYQVALDCYKTALDTFRRDPYRYLINDDVSLGMYNYHIGKCHYYMKEYDNAQDELKKAEELLYSVYDRFRDYFDISKLTEIYRMLSDIYKKSRSEYDMAGLYGDKSAEPFKKTEFYTEVKSLKVDN